jgi:lipopolysaccharide export system protein LptC
MLRGKKRLISFAGITILALLAWWFTDTLGPAKKLMESGDSDPDYSANNVVITTLDKTGKRKYILKARRLTHFPADDTSALEFPELTQFNKGDAPVLTTANHGHLSSDKNKIVMTGQVKMTNVIKGDTDSDVVTSKKLTIILE